jgi:hypothetical protein
MKKQVGAIEKALNNTEEKEMKSAANAHKKRTKIPSNGGMTSKLTQWKSGPRCYKEL